MNKPLSLAVTAAILLAAGAVVSAPVVAAPAAQATTNAAENNHKIGKIKVDQGAVMLSNDGGAFTSAQTNEQVFRKERLMVTQQSSATVIYDNGCRHTFDKPGVYDLGATCVAAILPTGSAPMGLWYASAAVTGAGFAAILNKNSPNIQPVSH